MNRHYEFKSGKSLTIGERPLIMGILNVTPDSFSDGGSYDTPEGALCKARALVAEGADIIDIGAESTRPGAQKISAKLEQERLLKVLPTLAKEIAVPISVDTYKSSTAEAALNAGADFLNDVWGLQYEEEPMLMAKVAARFGVPIVVMHNAPLSDDDEKIFTRVEEFFRQSLKIAEECGILRENIILDPGIGFGKKTKGNLRLIKEIERTAIVDGQRYPVLLGPSRKRFIGDVLNLEVGDRLEGTLSTCVYAMTRGTEILRVHDVKEIARAAKIFTAIKEA